MFSARPARLGSVGQPERGKMSHEAKCLAIAVRPVVRSQSRRCSVGHRPSVLIGARLPPYVQKLRVTGGSRGGAVAAFSPVGRRCPSRPASVIVVQACFVLAVDGRGRVPLGAVLDRLSREIDEDLLFRPTDAVGPVRRNQYLLVEPPVSGVDHQIAYRPGLIVDDEVVDVADRCVRSLNVVSANLFGATQMDVA